MFMYTYIHTYLYTCIYTYIYIHIDIHIGYIQTVKSELVSNDVFSLFLIYFETGSKLNIYPRLFNHHYGFQQP